MKATPFSKEPYYPIVLSNGQDGIIINYTGSNYCPSSGHALLSETLGVTCGWYKSSGRSVNGISIQQIIRSGIEVIIYDAPCTPDYYEQSIDGKTGIVTTKLRFAKKVHMTVEAFLTDEGLWCEKVSIEKCPADFDFGFGFSLRKVHSGYDWLKLLVEPETEFYEGESELSFSYKLKDKKGMGILCSSEPFAHTLFSKDFVYHKVYGVDGMFGNVSEGREFSRILTCVDETECDDIAFELDKRKKLISNGYEAVKELHIERKKQRNGDTWVNVPDEKLQSIYNISRNHIDSNYNRTTGAISLGLLSNLWGGGLHCSYDVIFILEALMKSGNPDVAKIYKKFFIDQGKMGREALSKIGINGTAFTGWTNCKGEFARINMDLGYWLSKDKPMFHICEIVNRYIVWKYTDKTLTEEEESIIVDAVQFIEERLLKKFDGRYHLLDVQSGSENDVRVESDTYTIVMLCMALKAVAEMLGEANYSQIADEVIKDIDGNYRCDGVLMPYKNAPYTAGLQMDCYIFTLPQPIDIISVDKALEAGKTPWGYTFEQTTEEKRHWPWINSRAAICYSHEGISQKAMEHLEQIPNYCSSAGAIPEYIRIDGLPACYWYTTAHALAVWALHDAFAHTKGNTVRLLFGMTDKWKNFSCTELYLDNGITVSLEIEEGKLTYMKLTNKTDADITLDIVINDVFSPSGFQNNCKIEAEGSFVFDKRN